VTSPVTDIVEIAWSTALTGVFTLDSSLLGGPDVLSAPIGSGSYTWTDVTREVKSVAITRGRPSDLQTMQQGTCTLRLKDSAGKYNTLNPTSPLAGQLVPMRPLRVRRTLLATSHYLFFGFINQIEHDPVATAQESVIQAVDGLEWLNRARPPAMATQINQTTAQLITAILVAVGWSDPAMRNIQAGGDVVPVWQDADGVKTALTLIQNLLQTDLGVFFFDAQGRATYFTREYMLTGRAAVATFDGTMVTAIKGSADALSIVNGQTVTRTGGVAQTAIDGASRDAYGNRDGTPIVSPNLRSDAQALGLAQWLVGVQSQPRAPIRGIGLASRSDAELTQQLTREIGDVVTITEPRGGSNVVATIQSVAHQYDAPSQVQRTTYIAQKAVATGFVLDASTLNGPDVLTY